MISQMPSLREDLVGTCREMNRIGLNQGTSGNLSHRIDGGLLITPTGMPYERMTSADLVDLGVDGTVREGGRPSSEWRFHRDILQRRSDANVVLHAHPVFCTALAVHRRGIPSFHYMIAVAGGDDIRCAPYACFGSQALSDAAITALEGRQACLLGHHGLIVLGQTFAKALWLAVEVETLARVYVSALAMGEPPLLDAAQMAEVHATFAALKYGERV